MKSKNSPASRVALMGLMFALAMALSFLEGMLPPVPAPVPGIRLGLSNIVTMYCLFSLGTRSAFTVALLKSGFVLLTRGAIGAFMSLSGGLCSVGVMFLLLKAGKNRYSQIFISICGAVFHNLGQLVAASFVIGSGFVIYYLPIMVISGIGMGVLTGLVLKTVMPYMNKLKG